MAKISVQIMAGNLGDGWKDLYEAAKAYGKWLEEKYGYDVEVSPHSGVGGGSWDENGDEVDTNDAHWIEWCESPESAEYAE